MESCWWVVFVGWMISVLVLLMLVRWFVSCIELMNFVFVLVLFLMLNVRIVLKLCVRYFLVVL